MEEFLAEIFSECMILNKRFFSEKDFKALLKTQRLDENYNQFNDKVQEYIKDNLIDNYIYENNKWQPVKGSCHPEISKIIIDLDLHMEVELSLDEFCDISCDIVQKINNYLWLCDDKALQ